MGMAVLNELVDVALEPDRLSLQATVRSAVLHRYSDQDRNKRLKPRLLRCCTLLGVTIQQAHRLVKQLVFVRQTP